MKRFVCALCLILLTLCAVASAEEASVTFPVDASFESGSINTGLSNDDALQGFINQAFGIGTTSSGRGTKKAPRVTQGSKLAGPEAKLYSFLREAIADVAAGNTDHTQFSIPYSELFDKLSYTAEELGVDAIIVDGAFTDAAVSAFQAKMYLNTPAVLSALLVDCPYDLFWYDKTAGYVYSGYGYSSDYETIYVPDDSEYTITMAVAEEYAPENPDIYPVSFSDGTTKDYIYEYDISLTQSITTAANNAKAIVAANSGNSDYNKLKAYKEAICERVEYNYDAAENDSTPYGNPWQLVWVFDDDASTKVVCEGYSKAFKYLCDESDFKADISCILVTGYLGSGTGAGRHMWNVVKMGDNKRYLVDVTNCDTGFSLFLVGYQDISERDGKTWYIYDGQLAYLYDDNLTDLFSEEELQIASVDFDPANSRLAAPVISNVQHGTTIGTEFTATVTGPSEAEVVYTELYYWDETKNDYVSTFYWTEDSRISILGFWFEQPGKYQLRSQALSHYPGEEAHDDDSEEAVYEFTLTDTTEDAPVMNIDDKVTLSKTDGIEWKETITYTIEGAEAVAFQMYDPEGEWGTNPPEYYTIGETDSLTFQEVGNTTITFWGRYNGVWSHETQITVFVQPLGYLNADLRWGNKRVGDDITINVNSDLTFTLTVENAERVSYYIYNPDDQNDWSADDDREGETLVIDLNSYQLPAGEYRMQIGGYREAWYSKTRFITLHLVDDIYQIDSGIITQYLNNTTTALVIPDTIDGHTVTGIGDSAFSGHDELTSVTFPDGMNSIGEFAFDGCTSLNTITLPESLTALQAGAFLSCPLTSVQVTSGAVKDWYFYEPGTSGLPRLYRVALPESVTVATAPFLGSSLPSMTPDFVTPQQLTTIEASAFADTAPEFVWLTNSVTSIGSGAFNNCSRLKFVRIPSSCTSFGEDAFPNGTILLVEWGDAAMDYAQENGYEYICYAEGFNG